MTIANVFVDSQDDVRLNLLLMYKTIIIIIIIIVRRPIITVQDGTAYGCCGVERSRSFNVFVCLFCV